MLPTMIPQIHFYDNSRKCYKITYYEKNYIQTAYYSYDTLIASTHNDHIRNTAMKYHLDPTSDKYTNTTAKHIKEMLGFDKKQYAKEYEAFIERERKRENSVNCHIDTYHEALYITCGLLVPFGSTDVTSFAKTFLWAIQTFFAEYDLIEQIENMLEDVGAEPGDMNNYFWALYQVIENEIWERIDNMYPEELVEILEDNGWTAMAKHVQHLIDIGDFDNEREDMIERRRNDQHYSINACASSFDWEPLDYSVESENYDQTLARVFEGAYRQYIDENYDGVCDADDDSEEECV